MVREIETWLVYWLCMTLTTFAMIHFFVLVRFSCTVSKIVREIITRNQLGIVTYHVSLQNYVFHLYAYHVFLILRLAFKNYRPWKSLHLMDRIWKFFLPCAKKSQYKFLCLKRFAETIQIHYHTINLLSFQFYHGSRYLMLKIWNDINKNLVSFNLTLAVQKNMYKLCTNLVKTSFQFDIGYQKVFIVRSDSE